MTAARLQALTVSPASPRIPVGLQQALTATGVYTDGSTADLTSLVQWSSTSPGVATVSGGIVTALSVGSTTIEVREPDSGISASVPVTVVAAVLQALALDPPQATLAVGVATPFRAMGRYSDETVVDMTELVAWSTSAPDRATVSNAVGNRGRVSPLAAGAVVLTAEEPVSGLQATAEGLASIPCREATEVP